MRWAATAGSRAAACQCGAISATVDATSKLAYRALSAPVIKTVAMESAMLAPKSEVSMYPWKDTKEKIPMAVRQVRTFMRAHRSATA